MRQFHGGVNREEPDNYRQAVSTCASAAATRANLSGWTSATECPVFAPSPPLEFQPPFEFQPNSRKSTNLECWGMSNFRASLSLRRAGDRPAMCTPGRNMVFPYRREPLRDSRNFACRQRVQSAGKSSVSKSSRNTIQVPYPGWWRNSSRNLTRRKD